jgi:hypothetical protein
VKARAQEAYLPARAEVIKRYIEFQRYKNLVNMSLRQYRKSFSAEEEDSKPSIPGTSNNNNKHKEKSAKMTKWTEEFLKKLEAPFPKEKNPLPISEYIRVGNKILQ